ncbi:MAG TPA: MFS transporter, partial [Polyangia bacterium]|nr:MFS transporter [Polyangia bacterium]
MPGAVLGPDPRAPKARLLPASATSDARVLLLTRGLRGFADGVVSILLASYLTQLGFSPIAVGAIVTGTLLGSAALTITVGLLAHRIGTRRLLMAAALLMVSTGLGFAGFSTFWPLLLVAVVGTLNPSAGDVSVFLPTEQAALAQAVHERERTLLYAWYNLIGALAGAAGALASGFPELLARHSGLPLLDADKVGFLVYAALAIAAGLAYRGLSGAIEPAAPQPNARPLARSRALVLHLAALFSLDSFGGGFVVQALLVLWLYRRFHLSTQTAASIFFVIGLLGAFSQLVSARIARRIGLVRTMVYTHLPSNLFLVLAGLMPNLELAVLFLVARAGLSQMDVPARQSFVMAVVPPEERAAASSIT